ncbi:MAG TPA: c-type cytochrome [Caldimonas sp.]|nr:c-type cytochrome [Caldimonas sp.]HEX4234103.1 c-type cytochrome [Caldimonas sp.]
MTTGRTRFALAAIAAIGVLAVAIVAWLNGDDEMTASPPATDPAGLVARGEYLVRAGSCLGCHTEPGGAPFAGGRAIETPFGVVHAPNLTPDATGLAAWSSDDFWRALHNGRSRGRRLLAPAFPYPNYTRLARADSDAMFAYLRSIAPVAKPNKAHALRFPFDQQAALALWRALFFRPARFEIDTSQSPQWNRGAYLVETLGHCNACHSQRNVFGATAGPLDLAGGLIPIQNWYAPSLSDDREAGVADWPASEIVALLKSGISVRGSVQGPMAEVVARSTQYLRDDDLTAMAVYLQTLPGKGERAAATPERDPAVASARGATLYNDHCATCHGEQGEGVAGAYPTLVNNRAVALSPPANLVHIVLRGGFLPTTPGNPRPFGMPPFATVLSDQDVADVLSYLRASWGHRAAAVSTLEVSRYRGAALR